MSTNYDDIRVPTDNLEPRCPVVLVLDTSGSMDGNPIRQLNEGLQQFFDQLRNDPIALKRVDLSIVTFGPVKQIADFQNVNYFNPPTLSASGYTPMGEAVVTAIDLVRQRKELYKASGISYYRPWILLMTDGGPTDDIQTASQFVEQGETDKRFAFFAIGVEGADFAKLKTLSKREVLRLKDYNYAELFAWLRRSLSTVSRSGVSDTVKIEAPGSSWSEIQQ